MCAPLSGLLRDVHGVYREEKRKEGDRGGQEDKRGESKAESQIQLVINSLSVLHHLEHKGIHRVGKRREGGGKR